MASDSDLGLETATDEELGLSPSSGSQSAQSLPSDSGLGGATPNITGSTNDSALGKIKSAAQVAVGYKPASEKQIRFVAGLTPISPISEAMGQTYEDLQAGKSVPVALKGGAKAGAFDAGVKVATGGLLPSGVAKLGESGLAKVLLDKGVIPSAISGIGKPLFKAGFSGAKEIRSDIIDDVLADPGRVLGVRKSIDAIGKTAYDGYNNIKNTVGELIGNLKSAASEAHIPMSPTYTEDLLSQSRKGRIDANLLRPDGRVPIDDVLGNRAFDIIDEKLAMKPSGNGLMKNRPVSVEDAQNQLNSIDAKFLPIYNRMDSGKGITQGERAALQVRQQLSDSINSAVESIFDKEIAAQPGNEVLKQAKQQYSLLKKAQNDPQLKLALSTQDGMSKKLRTMVTETNQGLYEKMKALDSAMPEDSKFLNDAVTEALHKYTNIIPVVEKSHSLLGGGVKTLRTGAQAIGNQIINPNSFANKAGAFISKPVLGISNLPKQAARAGFEYLLNQGGNQ